MAFPHLEIRLKIPFLACFGLLVPAIAFAAAKEGREQSGSGLKIPANPTVQEIFRARVFEEPLVPVGGEPSADENTHLSAALVEYSKRSGPDDFSSLTAFLEKHPKSPWCAALLTDLGLEYYNTAHYSKALAAWQRAWTLAKDAADSRGKAVADRASGELAYM